MNIKELIKELQTLPQELDILMASDSEGNNFKEVSDLCMSESSKFAIIYPNDTSYGYFENSEGNYEMEKEFNN